MNSIYATSFACFCFMLIAGCSSTRNYPLPGEFLMKVNPRDLVDEQSLHAFLGEKSTMFVWRYESSVEFLIDHFGMPSSQNALPDEVEMFWFSESTTLQFRWEVDGGPNQAGLGVIETYPRGSRTNHSGWTKSSDESVPADQ